MNVNIVSHMFPTPQDSVSGIFVLQQAEALSQRGHDITVVSPTPYVPKSVSEVLNRPPSSEIPEQDSYGAIDVHYPRYWSLPRSETLPIVAYSFRRTLNKHRDLFESADIINAHVALPDGFGCTPVARSLEIPLVTTIHGADIYKTASNSIAKKQIQSVFDRADRVIMNSNRLLQEAKELFQRLNNTHVVYNGIPTERITRIQPESISELFEGERLVVATVGTLIPRKGHKDVLGALERISVESRPYYLIIGDGSLREELEIYVTDAGLDEYVYFTGYVPEHDSVFAKLKSADVMAMPSTDEAFGIAYLEAMACGLPVIACEGEGPADFITNRETGFLVPPKDPDAIADVIQELQTYPELRDRIASRGQRTALNGFSWERNAKSTERIFQKTIDTHE